MSATADTAAPEPAEFADAEVVLRVRDLKKHFPVHKGVLSRVVGQVFAVDGVSFDIRRGETLRRYEYVTTAAPATLERWLTLLLVDMGLDPAGPVALSVRPGEIGIERILPTTAGRPPGGG